MRILGTESHKWSLAKQNSFKSWKIAFNLWNDSERRVRVQYKTHVLLSHSTVEKEFLIHVSEICYKSGMLIKSYRYWLFNWQAEGGKWLSDQFSSKVLVICFQGLVSFTYSWYVRGNDVMANGIRHQLKLKKFVQEYICWYKWIYIAGIKTKCVLIRNPMFWKSKYAFRFPFSIYVTKTSINKVCRPM